MLSHRHTPASVFFTLSDLAVFVDEWKSGGTLDHLASCVAVLAVQAMALRTSAMGAIMQKGLDGCEGEHASLSSSGAVEGILLHCVPLQRP